MVKMKMSMKKIDINTICFKEKANYNALIDSKKFFHQQIDTYSKRGEKLVLVKE